MNYLHISDTTILGIVSNKIKNKNDYKFASSKSIHRKIAQSLDSGLQLIIKKMTIDKLCLDDVMMFMRNNDEMYKNNYQFLVLPYADKNNESVEKCITLFGINKLASKNNKRPTYDKNGKIIVDLYVNYIETVKYFGVLNLLAIKYADIIDEDWGELGSEYFVDNIDGIVTRIYLVLFSIHKKNKKIIKHILRKRICSDCVGKILEFII